MSRWALQATLLIAVDAYAGHWCRLDWLVRRAGVERATVHALCDRMAEAGLIQHAVIDGEPCYGMQISGAALEQAVTRCIAPVSAP